MALSLRLLVLAALQMFLSPVSPSVPALLAAPKLLLHPPLRESIEGEHLSLQCLAPGAEEATKYQFFDPSGKQVSVIPHSIDREAWLHLTANRSTAGMYTCTYWRKVSSQEVSSEKSSPIAIRVKDPPHAPSFSVHPRYKEYRLGTTVELQCSAPAQAHNIKGFQYFGGKFAVLSLVSSRRNYTYKLSITGSDVSGSFSCCYWMRLRGRNVQSEMSEPVEIFVKGDLYRQLAVGGSFFTLNSLIFLTTYCLMKRQDSQRAKAEEEAPIYMSIDPPMLPSPDEPAPLPASDS